MGEVASMATERKCQVRHFLDVTVAYGSIIVRNLITEEWPSGRETKFLVLSGMQSLAFLVRFVAQENNLITEEWPSGPWQRFAKP